MGMTDMLQRKFTEFGIEKGIEQGIGQEKLKTARKSIDQGLSDKVTANITGLTLEQIAVIRKGMAAN